MDFSAVWFYTLSTSAQVLAALVGLFAVFVVNKIQATARLFEDVKSGIASITAKYSSRNPDFPENITLIEAFLSSDRQLLEKFDFYLSRHEALAEAHKSVEPGVAGQDPVTGVRYGFDRESYLVYKQLLDKRDSILREFRLGVVCSFLEISLCILLLTFSEYAMSKGVLFLNAFLMLATLYVLMRATFRVGVE